MSNMKNPERAQAEAPKTPIAGPAETGVKIDGLQQVIEMLKYADPAFRESLLKRLTNRDPQLAQSLRRFIR